MIKKQFRQLLFALLLPIGLAQAEDGAPTHTYIESERHLPVSGVTEVTLKNGMRIAIKPTDYDEDEAFVQIVAPGGYASLPKATRPSGILAAKIATESGLGEMSVTELNYAMYRDSIELTMEIDKTHRSIEATVPGRNLDRLLKIVNKIFTENKLTEEALKAVIERERDSIRNRHMDKDQTFEVMHIALNTLNSKSLKPLSLKAINRVDLKMAADFYSDSFTNPKDYVMVIVGDVDVEEAKRLLDMHLGGIENKSTVNPPCCPEIPPFPKGVTRRVLPSRMAREAYTRITIPLVAEFNPETAINLELMTLYMEQQLRLVMQEEVGKTNGIDVGYELPLFPYAETIWLTINFHCSKDSVSKMEKKIIKRITAIQREGVTLSELEGVKKHQKSSDEFWMRDNYFWQANLANHYLWSWNPDQIVAKHANYSNHTPETINRFMSASFTPDNYTILSSQP